MAVDTLLKERAKYQPNIIRTDDVGGDQPHVYMRNLKSGDVILWPFPMTVQSNFGVQWEQRNFTKFGQAAHAAGKTWESALAAQGDQGSTLGATIGTMMKGASQAAVMNLGNLLGSQEIQDLTKHAQGRILHPMSEMTFQGIGFREFSLQFQIAPVSEGHQDRIAQAVQYLQVNALPDPDDSELKYLNYPGSWSVRFEPTDLYLPTILDCVVTDASIDYGAATRMSMHPDNGPVKIGVTINLTETKIFTAEDAKKGFYG